MHSCLYAGRVRHRRFSPVPHVLRYRLFMAYLDLDELDAVFRGRWCWSTRRAAPIRFRREDHHGAPGTDLAEATRDVVAERLGRRPAGPVRLLTHLRHFGYCFNPVSFFYCFDEQDTGLDAVVLEVNNMPWRERCLYVLDTRTGEGPYWFGKEMHVSPFMGMDQRYRCALRRPGRGLAVHLENWREDEKLLDATLTLHRRAITGPVLARTLLRHPFMTQKVTATIHWEALKLWRKGVPYHPHPASAGGPAHD